MEVGVLGDHAAILMEMASARQGLRLHASAHGADPWNGRFLGKLADTLAEEEAKHPDKPVEVWAISNFGVSSSREREILHRCDGHDPERREGQFPRIPRMNH